VIPKPLIVSGCAVRDCPGEVVAIVEVLADIVFGRGSAELVLEVPICGDHAEAMDSNARHPGASFYRPRGPLIRRAVTIDPKARQRWPTYQELVQALTR